MTSLDSLRSFTINLISNSSTNTYPGKTIASFTNLLPKTIDLNKKFGRWQVALLKISWPAEIQNVTEGLLETNHGESESSDDDNDDHDDDGDKVIEPTSADALYVDIGRHRRRPTGATESPAKIFNLRCTIDTGYYPSIDHLMRKIFDKSFRSRHETDWPYNWCTSSYSQKLKILALGHQKDDFQSTENEEDGFLTAASSSEDEGQQTWNGTTPFETPSSIELISSDLQNILGTDILKVGVNPKFPVDISGGRHTMTSYRMKYWATLSRHFLDQFRSIIQQIGN